MHKQFKHRTLNMKPTIYNVIARMFELLYSFPVWDSGYCCPLLPPSRAAGRWWLLHPPEKAAGGPFTPIFSSYQANKPATGYTMTQKICSNGFLDYIICEISRHILLIYFCQSATTHIHKLNRMYFSAVIKHFKM